MNRGLMLKSIHELLPTTLLCGLALSVIESVLAYVMPTFAQQFSQQMLQVQFIQNLIKAMLGMNTGEALGPEMFTSIPWAHPVVLAIVWAHAIVCCTRVPAGEVDRGTIDVLLGLPVSRWEVLTSDTIVWLGSSIFLAGTALIGNAIGSSAAATASQPDMTRRLIVLANLLCLYFVVGSFGWFVSTLSDRRGRAITLVFAVVLASFLLNYLAQFWSVAEKVSFLSILTYYRPLIILRDGHWPMRDMAILMILATLLWSVAGAVFARRDLCTV
jgi:beta-exotoxin I transport system permease protein